MLAIVSAISPTTAFSIDLTIAEELDQLPGDLANDVEEESDLLQEVEKAGEIVKDANDSTDEVTDAVEEEVRAVEDDLEDDVFDLTGEIVDEVAEDDSLLSSAVEEVEEVTREVIDEAEDSAFGLVDKVEDEAEVVVEETTDLLSSGVEDVAGLTEDVIENLEDDADVADTTEKVADDIVDAELVDEVEETADSVSEELAYKLKAIQNPILTEKEIGEIIAEALDLPGLEEWSSDGWQFVSMDFIGEITDDAEWERAVVYLHLPDGAGSPPEECFHGWLATVELSLETGKVEDSGYPTEESHECTSEVVLDDPDAAAKPSFVIAGADDVISNDIYGNIAYLKTPSYEPEIFDHMDRYIAHLLNQKWKTFPMQDMTQVGWLITTVEGCVNCGSGYIPANSSAVVFTDTSIFGNLEAHRIPFDWEPDGEVLAETICYDDTNYLISVLYNGQIFNHNTKIPCENTDNDSKTTNSVFFENWNTVGSSSWAQDITGKVEAHSAHEFIHSSRNLTPWMASTNEEQRCDAGRAPTAIINGTLASGNVATWSELGKVPPAC